MEAAGLHLSGAPTPIFSAFPPSTPALCTTLAPVVCPTSLESIKLPPTPVVCRSKKAEEQDLYGLPKEYYDDVRNGKPGNVRKLRNFIESVERRKRKRKERLKNTGRLERG